MHWPYGTTNLQDMPNICQQCHQTENDRWPGSTRYLHIPFTSSLLRSAVISRWIVGFIQIPVSKRWNKHWHDKSHQMQIDTGNSNPVSQKPYPIGLKHYEWIKDEINKLLEAKIICSSHSSWSAPIIVVPKDNGGKCLVINYRALNKVTQKFVWLMHKVEDISSKLNGVKYFSALDTITDMPQCLKQPSHLLLANASPWKFLLH